MKFSEWIVSELNERGWSRSEAARRGKISPSVLDKVINGASEPGIKFFKGLANAFGISLFEIIARYEEMPLTPNDDQWEILMNYKVRQLKDPKLRPIAQNFFETLLAQESAEKTKQLKPKVATNQK